MFDPRPLCCSSLTTAVGGTKDTNFVDSKSPYRGTNQYSTYTICKIYIQCSDRRRLLDGSTHCVGGCPTGAPVSVLENGFETYEKNELKKLSECTFLFR